MTRQARDVDRKTRRLADLMAVDSDREDRRLLGKMPITGRKDGWTEGQAGGVRRREWAIEEEFRDVCHGELALDRRHSSPVELFAGKDRS